MSGRVPLTQPPFLGRVASPCRSCCQLKHPGPPGKLSLAFEWSLPQQVEPSNKSRLII